MGMYCSIMGRIMGRIGEEAPIEIARFQTPYFSGQWDFHVRGISHPWFVWKEFRTPEKRLISQRMIT